MNYNIGGQLPLSPTGDPYLVLKYCILRKRMGKPLVTKVDFENFTQRQIKREAWRFASEKLIRLGFVIGDKKTGLEITNEGAKYPYLVALRIKTRKERRKLQDEPEDE